MKVVVGISEDSELAEDLKKRYSGVDFVFDPENYGLVEVNTYDKHTDLYARWHGIGKYNHPG